MRTTPFDQRLLDRDSYLGPPWWESIPASTHAKTQPARGDSRKGGAEKGFSAQHARLDPADSTPKVAPIKPRQGRAKGRRVRRADHSVS